MSRNYLLDTNIVVAILRARVSDNLVQELERHRHELCISTVTLMELETGVFLSEHQARSRVKTDDALARLTVLPFDEAAARQAGLVRGQLLKAGTQIGPYDSEIAGHALALNAILVTNNLREFSRVKGLEAVDWLNNT